MLETKPINKDHILYDKTVVMTGFRDKELENQIKNVGGKTGSTVNKNTFVLIVKDLSESSGKWKMLRNMEYLLWKKMVLLKNICKYIYE